MPVVPGLDTSNIGNQAFRKSEQQRAQHNQQVQTIMNQQAMQQEAAMKQQAMQQQAQMQAAELAQKQQELELSQTDMALRQIAAQRSQQMQEEQNSFERATKQAELTDKLGVGLQYEPALGGGPGKWNVVPESQQGRQAREDRNTQRRGNYISSMAPDWAARNPDRVKQLSMSKMTDAQIDKIIGEESERDKAAEGLISEYKGEDPDFIRSMVQYEDNPRKVLDNRRDIRQKKWAQTVMANPSQFPPEVQRMASMIAGYGPDTPQDERMQKRLEMMDREYQEPDAEEASYMASAKKIRNQIDSGWFDDEPEEKARQEALWEKTSDTANKLRDKRISRLRTNFETAGVMSRLLADLANWGGQAQQAQQEQAPPQGQQPTPQGQQPAPQGQQQQQTMQPQQAGMSGRPQEQYVQVGDKPRVSMGMAGGQQPQAQPQAPQQMQPQEQPLGQEGVPSGPPEQVPEGAAIQEQTEAQQGMQGDASFAPGSGWWSRLSSDAREALMAGASVISGIASMAAPQGKPSASRVDEDEPLDMAKMDSELDQFMRLPMDDQQAIMQNLERSRHKYKYDSAMYEKLQGALRYGAFLEKQISGSPTERDIVTAILQKRSTDTKDYINKLKRYNKKDRAVQWMEMDPRVRQQVFEQLHALSKTGEEPKKYRALLDELEEMGFSVPRDEPKGALAPGVNVGYGTGTRRYGWTEGSM